jgi:hypothetical protein
MKKLLFSTICCVLSATLIFVACKNEEPLPLPADAGAITGADANDCPLKTVDLSVNAIAEALTYVWYNGNTVVDGFSGTTCTATASGEYTVAGKNAQGEGKRSPAHTVTINPCPGEDGAIPAAAGSITGPAVNDCPANAATLTVEAITGAASYRWLITYGQDDTKDTLTTGPVFVDDFSNIVIIPGAALSARTYTVAGVNSLGDGEASPAHVVTKQPCLASKPVIVGRTEWLDPDAQVEGISAVYTTVCPATQMAGTATTVDNGVEIISYKWYRQLVSTPSSTVSESLTEWNAAVDAVMPLGSPGNVYNFAVKAITADGESDMSDVIQVIGTPCYTPGKPGNSTSPSIYPLEIFPVNESGMPVGSGIISVTNCDIQDKTGNLEDSVVLVISRAWEVHQNHPITGYKFYVKETEGGDYRNVHTTEGGYSVANIRFKVDGTTNAPSGTYAVTAYNSDGESDFGDLQVAVTIRTDCPAPAIKLPAPTVSGGGSLVDGVRTNVCPAATVSTLYLNAPSGNGQATNYKWSRVTDANPVPETVLEGVDNLPSSSLTVAQNGTYTLTYTKNVDGTPVESLPLTVVLGYKICPPTFASKPTSNVWPNDYAEVVIAAPPAAVASLITGYAWYNSRGLSAPLTAVTNQNTASSLTYHILRSDTYTVKAIADGYESSANSEPVAVTLSTATPSAAFTRADLVGTYTVSDFKNHTTDTPITYSLTLSEGTTDDQIIVAGIGGNAALTYTATVSFTNDGVTTGNFGTIAIPQITVGTNGVPRISNLSSHGNPPVCVPGDITFTIKSIAGNPGVSQTGVNYGAWSTTTRTCPAVADTYGGGATKTVIWVKN